MALTNLLMRIALLIFVTTVVAVLAHALEPDRGESMLLTRSQFDSGNIARLQRVMTRAQHGEPVTIGFIGGSITYGERATSADRQFANRVAAWFVDRFPQSKITMINAGLPGTGSGYGCLRASRDLLSHHPDFVVVEFGVNDRDDLDHVQFYEGLVRQILHDSSSPAIMLLFALHHDGTNAQRMQGEVGRRYQLPMISDRDAVWPLIEDGQLKISDVLADTVHPNDRGHGIIAACIIHFLESTLVKPREAAAALPAQPRFTDLFERTQLLEASSLKPRYARGWNFDTAKHCWATSEPGSVIEFEVPGRVIDLLYNRASTAGGTAMVSVDGTAPVLCDAWFDGTWAGHCQTDVVGQGLSPSMHRVRVELSIEQNALSNGHEFQILGLGCAGN